MAKITKLCVGESLVGEGNEVAHIDLIMGPRGSAAESAFAHALTNNKDGFTSLLAVVAPNLLTKPATVMFNKVTIKGAKQAVQMFGPAQHAVAKAVADSVAEEVRGSALRFRDRFMASNDPSHLHDDLMAWDTELKARGINPGTSADLTVATLFVSGIGR